MHKIVIDTSVYIPLLRDGKAPGTVLTAHGSMVYLSSVVAQELFAGAVDRHTMKALGEFWETFEKNDRIITPEENDWMEAGKLLSKIGQKYGFESIKKGRLVNDVLITLSCRKSDSTLITANHKDFKVINEFVKFQFIGI